MNKYNIFLVFCLIFACKKELAIHPNFEGLDREYFLKSSVTEIKEYNNPHVENIKVPILNKERMELLTSSIIDSLKLIKLETSEDCMIGTINKIIIHNDNIYILDSNVTKSLYQFSIKGEFVRKYGNYGKGPGEYLFPIDFNIDTVKNEIIILDNHSSKLLFYNIKGGHKRSVRTGFFATDFIIENNDLIFNQTRSKNNFIPDIENFSLVRTDSVARIKNLMFPINLEKQEKFHFNSRQNFVKNKLGLFYQQPLNNVIYNIKKGKLIPAFNIELGDRALPKNFDFDINYEEFRNKYKNTNYLFFEGDYLITKNHLVFNLSNSDGMVYKIFYSLKTKKIKVTNFIHTGGDKRGFGTFENVSVYDDFFVSYINSYNVCKIKEVVIKHQDEQTAKIASETTENDNPIIILQKLKNF